MKLAFGRSKVSREEIEKDAAREIEALSSSSEGRPPIDWSVYGLSADVADPAVASAGLAAVAVDDDAETVSPTNGNVTAPANGNATAKATTAAKPRRAAAKPRRASTATKPVRSRAAATSRPKAGAKATTGRATTGRSKTGKATTGQARKQRSSSKKPTTAS